MATNRTQASRAGLIRCSHCGEDYSASYRRCPFCDEYEDDYTMSQRSGRTAQSSMAQRSAASSGGKRLATGTASASASTSSARPRSGGSSSQRRTSPFQVLTILISLAVILAAFWIVTVKLMPLIQLGNVDTVDADAPPNKANTDPIPDPSPSADPDPSPDLAGVAPNISTAPDTSPEPDTSPTPDTPPTTVSTAPAPGEATSFTMKSDVSLKYQGEVWRPVITFSPAGTSSTLVWESKNPSVASVTADGVVTAVAQGTTTITVTMPNGVTHSCIVRCTWDSNTTASSSPSPSGSTSSQSYGINNPDFTFDHVGETYTVRVTGGYTGSVTWSSSDTSVATVNSDGLCTAVGRQGQRVKCVVTGTLDDGSTVQADVYVDLR